ncbi:SIR2 family NAD-dependent protein deacylase [Myroides odoratimimus]|uniref:SIR2-like domain-containing protein n=1 Tax=Myroides odoratimimus TaxID=76832 RepID=A0AAI8G5M9_9FLAO|nr:SIR2 family protein [Myroides odoratimimus]ALU27452.1 hypothetical protein AS202_15415 [Myroides odoratimimus]
MTIKDYISKFNTHPVLFVGTGLSLRYLNKSYNWEDLLNNISNSIFNNNDEKYLDIKAECLNNDKFDYPKIGSILEKSFNEFLDLDINRHGEFKHINDRYYDLLKKDNKVISKLKLYISFLLQDITTKPNMKGEVELLKQLKNNISSVITTNYDLFLEEVFGFKPLIGNGILLSNPYGSLYKIHGCINDPEQIVISQEDYEKTQYQHELIRAQLLSLFIHNPVIFLGYGAQDDNVNGILKTVFKYAKYNTDTFQKIKENFLIVEYEKDSQNEIISDYDLKIDETPIQIKKLKTDNYSALYKELIEMEYPISAVDIRKVQNVMYETIANAKDHNDKAVKEVVVIDSKEEINTGDRVLVITYGDKNTVDSIKKTIFKDKVIPTQMKTDDFIDNYFEIIADKNIDYIKVIDNITIPSNHYFPIFGFIKVFPKLKSKDKIKNNQLKSFDRFIKQLEKKPKKDIKKHTSIEDVNRDSTISLSAKHTNIVFNIWNNNIPLDNLEAYLKNYPDSKKHTEYRRLISLYDYKLYN